MPVSNIPTSKPPEEAEEPPSPPERLQVSILVDDEIDLPLARSAVRAAVAAAARFRRGRSGELGVRITDDASIREINRRHLDHDYATDVISFGYRWQPPWVEGELVVSLETARREAARLGAACSKAEWGVAEELLLYVVHGVLHVTGMEDHDPADRREMRRAEQSILTELGLEQIRHFGADADRRSVQAGSGSSV